MSVEEKVRIAAIGLGFGIAGTLMTVGFIAEPVFNEARVFQREEGKPAIIRLYKQGRDGLLVQDLENGGKYIPLSVYLNKIKDPADRHVEEATIKKAAEWYK